MDYPGPFEILVVDDHSTDQTASKVLSFANSPIRLLSNPGQGKRAALAEGIRAAQGEIVLLTDADCLPGPDWMEMMASRLLGGTTRWVSGPVIVLPGKGMLSTYDSLESHGMMVITGATFFNGHPELAQGASIAFFKHDFYLSGGYDHFPNRASGDDVLLMERFQKAFPGQCCFLHDNKATVYTHAPDTWHGLITQRIRWASKSGAIGHVPAKLKMGLVYAMSWAFLIFMSGLPFWDSEIRQAGFVVLGLKVVADLFLLAAGLGFTRRWFLMAIFIPAIFIHPLLVVLAGSIGPFRKSYFWKARIVR